MDEQLSDLESVYKNLGKNALAKRACDIAMKQIMACQEFKKPRINRINLYLDLYNGKTTKKLRQLFNVPIPVFAGMVDTLNAMYDTPIMLDFQPGDAADWMKVEKINSAWKREVLDSAQNSKWDAKFRIGRKDKIITGREIYRYWVTSDPEYKSEILNVGIDKFNFQPKGGNWLENHLFAGDETITKTKSQLLDGVRNGIYDKEQVQQLISTASNSQFMPDDNPTFGAKLERFKPLGLDHASNSYIGEAVYPLTEHILEIDGKRWYLLFHPWTKKWIRFEKWADMCSSELYPWVSSASHEDVENFLPKSYADDLFPVADSIIALFNQELTNREKRNFGARAYDREMFPDVRKLDESSHRPDALVPVDTKGGTRQIGAGIYEFKVGELGGTINLIDWMEQSVGRQTGVTDIAQGSVQDVSKKASVSFMEQKAVSKRLSYGSAPYQEMVADLGKRFVYGLKDHMPAKMGIRVLGENGLEWDEITRLDLNTKKDIDILIVSTDKQMQESESEKNKKKEALTLLAQSPNVNAKWRDEQILRDVGGYDDVMITEAMDVNTYGNKKSLSKASESIQIILEGKVPELWYGADSAFMQKIVDFAIDHRTTLKGKYEKLLEYSIAHKEIAMQNMQRKASQDTQQMMQKQIASGQVMPQTQENTDVPGGISRAMNVAEQSTVA